MKEGGFEQIVLGWGSAGGQVGLRRGAVEWPAEGPSAVAVAPSGEVLVLDRLNERIIAVSPAGAAITRASVPRDAEHLAAGPDGATAAWSPVRATVWIAGRDGSPLGELAIPRAIQDVERIDLGLSHRVVAVTAMQETLQLGSPRAPLDLAAALRTRREGAALLEDGRAAEARLTEGGGAEIFVLRKAAPGADERPPVSWSTAVQPPVSAVRIVGAAGRAVCARIERVSQAEGPAEGERPLFVEREALCVEADTGRVLVNQPLGRPGLYTVHEDLAVGGNPPVLAFVRPEEAGLRVQRFPLEAPRGRATEVHQ